VKFDMGTDTLSTLGNQTQGASDDLGGLVRQLVDAAEPLAGKFEGSARQVFDEFKAESDQVASDLDSALTRILGGVRDMDGAFGQGETEMASEVRSAQSGADFDSARFR
jgi:uncharacterized protein YukE